MSVKGRELMHYVLPSVGGLCVTFLYNIVDGIFVGQGVGSTALGAVNVSVPFLTAAMALMAMLPMGGATAIAVRKGVGDKEGANRAFITSLSVTVLLSIVLTIFGMVFAREIVLACGGSNLSDEMVEMAVSYLFYYMAFCIPMLLAPCLSAFVRNDGAPGLAFIGLCAGAFSNIFLDWLFVFPLKWGVVGAAVASGLGQVVSCAILMSHFIGRRGELRIAPRQMDLRLLGGICKCGVPEVASQFTTPVTSFCYNIVIAKAMGDLGISTFSVLSFIFSLANAILMGVSQGMQPLWGRSLGMGDRNGLKFYLKAAFLINIAASVLIAILLSLFAPQAIMVFNNEPALVESGSAALPIFALSFIPMAANLIIAGYFFSIQETFQANAISMSRGIVLKALAIFIVPSLFGESLIWFPSLVSETLTLIVALVLLFRYKRKEGL